MSKNILSSFINEFSNPSVRFDEQSHSIHPLEIERYKTFINIQRLDFVETLHSSSSDIQSMYYEELKSKKKEVKDRGFYHINPDEVMTTMEDGTMIASFYLLDNILLNVLDKTVATIENFSKKEGLELVKNEDVSINTSLEKASDWMNINEVCARYNLPKNNIKSRKWRLQNEFPAHQDGTYCKVTFNAKEVEEYLARKKC